MLDETETNLLITNARDELIADLITKLNDVGQFCEDTVGKKPDENMAKLLEASCLLGMEAGFRKGVELALKVMNSVTIDKNKSKYNFDDFFNMN
jgi:hypothetical protein